MYDRTHCRIVCAVRLQWRRSISSTATPLQCGSLPMENVHDAEHFVVSKLTTACFKPYAISDEQTP